MRSKFHLILLALGVLFAPAMINGQGVVNMESKRIATDTTGWAGSAELDFNLSKFDEKQLSLGSKAHLQYKNLTYLYLLVGDLKWVEAGGESFVNDGFLHFRVNRKVSPGMRWEAFTQLQYNEILKVDSRFLLGTGPRFKLSQSENLKLYFAPLYMYEREVLSVGEDRLLHNHRLSNYLSTTLIFSDNVDFNSTIYYQPLIEEFADYRLAGEGRLNIGITDLLSFFTRFSYVYDADPPEGVPAEVYSLANGFKMAF